MRFIQYCSLLVLLASNYAFASECDFLPEAQKPLWIDGDPSISGFYVGVGVSREVNGDAQQQIETARQSALKNLSNNIEVSIQQDMLITEQVSEEEANTTAKKEVKSITKIVSGASLRNIKTDEVWLDRKHCLVWTRIKIADSIVKEIRNKDVQSEKLASLLSHINHTKDESLSIETRKENVALAKILLSEINFYILDDPKGEEYYKKLVESNFYAIEKLQQRKNTAESLFTKAKQLLEKSNNSSSKIEKTKLDKLAKNNLNKILTEFKYDTRNIWSESAALLLGELARTKGHDCAAQYYFQHIKNNTLQSDWKIKSESLLIGLSCDKAKQKDYKLRSIFEGAKILLTCVYKTQNSISTWDDLCDRVRNRMSAYGAIVEEKDFNDNQLKNIIRRKNKSQHIKNLNNYDKNILFIAKGAIAKRKSKSNPEGKDYQFKGKITSLILSGDKLEFSDKYSGAGGWNPISDDMAMEVLGVHVEKRWYKKYSKSL